MRVNVDSQVVLDPRFKRAAKALGCSWHEVLGRCLSVWFTCYERRAERLLADDIDVIADRDGFAAALVAADLAEHDGELVRLRGVAERIGFLLTQATRGRMGGLAKAKRPLSTRLAPSLATLTQSLTLDQDPDPALPPDQDKAQDQREALSREPSAWHPEPDSPAGQAIQRRIASGELTYDDVHRSLERFALMAIEKGTVYETDAQRDAAAARWILTERTTKDPTIRNLEQL